MMHELRLFLIAVQFLTRVPIPRWVGYQPDWLNQSARHFAGVGLMVGVVASGVLMLGHAWFNPAVAVGLSMAATLLLTGAFHEDGFADTCDALGGGASISRERALLIMKDSRLGTYGTVGLVMMLGLKATVLAALPLALAVPALLLAHTISRAASVVLIRALPYAGDLEHAKAKPLAQRITTVGMVVNLVWVLLVGMALVLLMPLFHPIYGASVLAPAASDALVVGWRWSAAASIWASLLLSVVCVAAAMAWCARWFHQRLGGYTGDTLGATQQITELTTLLAWLAVAQA